MIERIKDIINNNVALLYVFIVLFVLLVIVCIILAIVCKIRVRDAQLDKEAAIEKCNLQLEDLNRQRAQFNEEKLRFEEMQKEKAQLDNKSDRELLIDCCYNLGQLSSVQESITQMIDVFNERLDSSVSSAIDAIHSQMVSPNVIAEKTAELLSASFADLPDEMISKLTHDLQYDVFLRDAIKDVSHDMAYSIASSISDDIIEGMRNNTG